MGKFLKITFFIIFFCFAFLVKADEASAFPQTQLQSVFVKQNFHNTSEVLCNQKNEERFFYTQNTHNSEITCQSNRNHNLSYRTHKVLLKSRFFNTYFQTQKDYLSYSDYICNTQQETEYTIFSRAP